MVSDGPKLDPGDGGVGGVPVTIRAPDGTSNIYVGSTRYRLESGGVLTIGSDYDPGYEFFQESRPDGKVGGSVVEGGFGGKSVDEFRAELPITVTNLNEMDKWDVTGVDDTEIVVEIDGEQVGTVPPGESREFGSQSDGGGGSPLALLPAVGPLTSTQTTLAVALALGIGVFVLA